MNVDPGIAGFLAVLVALAAVGAWSVRRRRAAERVLAERGYREVSAAPESLMRRVAARLGGEPRRIWQHERSPDRWVIELLPRAEDEESTARIVVTAPLAEAFGGCLLFRSWQGASPDHQPGRLGTRLLEFGDARLEGLARLADPNRWLHGERSGYLAYAEQAFDLETRLPERVLARLPALADTASSLLMEGHELLLQAPFGKASQALDALATLVARLDEERRPQAG